MMIDRKIAHAPRTAEVARDMARLPGPCIGCKSCRGICAAMLDAMLVPDLILAHSDHAHSGS